MAATAAASASVESKREMCVLPAITFVEHSPPAVTAADSLRPCSWTLSLPFPSSFLWGGEFHNEAWSGPDIMVISQGGLADEVTITDRMNVVDIGVYSP